MVENDVSSTNSPQTFVWKSSHIPTDYWHPHEKYNPDEPSLTRCTPQILNALDSLLYYREKQRARTKTKSGPARQLSHGGTHHPERCCTTETMAPDHPPRPTRPARSRTCPDEHEDTHGDSPPASEKSLPPLRRRRVQEEPPVYPAGNNTRLNRLGKELPAPNGPTVEQIQALVNRAIKNNKYREVHQLCDKASHPFSAALRSIVLSRTVSVPPIEPYRVSKI